MRFANEEQKQRYMGYARKINANEAYDKEQKKKKIELEEKKKQYEQALSAMHQKDYSAALLILKKIEDYQEICVDRWV